MGDVWGSQIKISIFGESHGPAIGILIDGLPAGEGINMSEIETEMQRRAPGKNPLSTSRKEPDEVEILSGVWQGKTTGSSICAVIKNTNVRSQDYKNHLRPGHADWTALIKYKGFADMRGGGHFSGRLTAPLVFAGAVAKQVLMRRNICVHGRIAEIAGIKDDTPPHSANLYKKLAQQELPIYSQSAGLEMSKAILKAKSEMDSVGGVVEVVAFGVPGGLGNPFFESFESVASSLFFSIPAVKGVQFGTGFAFASLRGSSANDAITVVNGKITAASNNNGGILGGITNGMPVVASLAVKPTPSIALPQTSVNPNTMQEISMQTHGRHDPCVVPRCVPVAEAALALSILNCMQLNT